MRTLLITVLALAAFPAAAQDSSSRNLAAGCAICHGTEGRPVKDSQMVPLAGLPAGHIASQMRAFRDGKRPATVMHQIAKGYSEPQLQQLASYFAAQAK